MLVKVKRTLIKPIIYCMMECHKEKHTQGIKVRQKQTQYHIYTFYIIFQRLRKHYKSEYCKHFSLGMDWKAL